MAIRSRQTNPNALKKVLRKYEQNMVIKVGYPLSVKSVEYPTGESVTQVAIDNNFGSKSRNIPPRPFMKIAKAPAIKKIQAPLKILIHQLNVGSMTKKKMGNILGAEVQTVFKKTIVDIKEPPNSPETIARKKSANPLIDTMLMVNTLRYEVVRSKK